MRVKTSTNLFYIKVILHCYIVLTSRKLFIVINFAYLTQKEQILERHGRVLDLRICKEQFNERNEMTDEMLTLAEYGFQGAPKDGDPVVSISK